MLDKRALPEKCSVAVVGGGTAGLALATELKRRNVDSVLVLEREFEAGGVPRHCGHFPFGVREYGRLMKGPDYACKNVETALNAGVEIRTGVSVTALHPNGRLSLTTQAGAGELVAKRVVLCTGVRESSRSQRFIGGDRPVGILSTGALQTLVYQQAMLPFRRPVILGSELVSFSAISTCRQLGIRPVAMIEENDRVRVRRVIQPYLTLRGVALFTAVKNLRVKGRERVETINFTDASGRQQIVEADGAIISGHFRPEAALLRQSHLEVDPGSGGPIVDQHGQCSDPAYYCAGNLLRAAETSGWCWREGRMCAKWIADDLAHGGFRVTRTINIQSTDPALGFVIPQRLSMSDRGAGMQKMQIGLRTAVKGHLEVVSAGLSISQSRLNSRPLRRIQLPLTPLLNHSPDESVELAIRWDN